MINRLLLYLVIASTFILSGCLIIGKVVDENGVGVPGVTVTLSGDRSRTTTTDSSGKYRFGDLLIPDKMPEGSYTVTPSASGYIFIPARKNVTITTGTLDGSEDVPLPATKVDFQAYNSAQIHLRCYSFSMHAASTSTGETIGFTTYDGLSEEPLNDDWLISNEILPVILAGSSYIADYMIADNLSIYEYGTARLTVPNTDADNNGFPDFLEIENDVDISFRGDTSFDWNDHGEYHNITFAGTMSRSANSGTGSYSGTANKSAQSFDFTGSWQTLFLSTYLRYSISGGDTIIITDISDTETVLATVTFTRYGIDQIILDSFILESEGNYVTFRSSVLNRKGTFYRGNVQAHDGSPYTSWRDYAEWLIEIEDNNDWDEDGVPDLTDPLTSIPD